MARQAILTGEGDAWNSIFRQSRRWADSGIWDVILEALAGSGVADATLQMIDTTIVRAHHCAAGGKGEPCVTRSGASGRSRSHPRRYRDPAESPYEGSDCRDCQDFCVRRFPSCAHEALFEHDGELRLRLGPLSRRSFPIRNGVVQNQI
jgi:hypothetical protein